MQKQKYTKLGSSDQPKIYWLHVHRDGREERFATEPEHVGSLRVEVVSRDGNLITERTWTQRQANGAIWTSVTPRGKGWFYENADGSGTSWLRVREN